MMALRGARVAYIDECPEIALHEVLLRLLSGGANISGRGLYEATNKTGFRPSHLIMVNCNELPQLRVRKENMIRRVRALPALCKSKLQKDFEESDPTHVLRDDDLEEKLTAAACGAYMVECAFEWYEHGLGEEPQCCLQLKESIADNTDYLSDWVERFCDVDPDYCYPAPEALDAYNHFANRFNAFPIKKGAMHSQMAAKGFVKCKPTKGEFKNKNCYTGIRPRGVTFYS